MDYSNGKPIGGNTSYGEGKEYSKGYGPSERITINMSFEEMQQTWRFKSKRYNENITDENSQSSHSMAED